MKKQEKATVYPSKDRLVSLIRKMDIPEMRKIVITLTDVGWLNRNLLFKNSKHPDFQEAMEIIKQTLQVGWKPLGPENVA